MVKYICDNCEKEFDKKYNYNVHINRKYKCEAEEGKKDNKCEYCGVIFSTKGSMTRHKKKHCIKARSDEDKMDSMNKKIKELENEIKKMKEEKKTNNDKINEVTEEIKKMKEMKIINNVTNNITQNNITQNNNIIITEFGKEDMSIIDETYIIYSLNGGNNALLNLTKVVHFNPQYPNTKMCTYHV
jgi:hypothetical protein